MPLFKRKPQSVLHELEYVDKYLQIVSTKLGIAWNLSYDKKKRMSFLANVTMVTAIHGMPVTPDMMSSMYVRDVQGDLKAIVKRLRNLINRVRSEPKYFKIVEGLHKLLMRVEGLLKVTDISVLLKEVESIRNSLRIIMDEVRIIETLGSTNI